MQHTAASVEGSPHQRMMSENQECATADAAIDAAAAAAAVLPGKVQQAGSGEGKGYTINIPLPGEHFLRWMCSWSTLASLSVHDRSRIVLQLRLNLPLLSCCVRLPSIAHCCCLPCQVVPGMLPCSRCCSRSSSQQHAASSQTSSLSAQVRRSGCIISVVAF